ncbi:MAG: hypothetical protein KDK36_19215, partial [Leptospiraceae bacterium]|nr:hypothetical protein [Leptospiraceae bacterium]
DLEELLGAYQKPEINFHEKLNHKLINILTNFLNIFSLEEITLILFFDDIQWMNKTDFEILQKIILHTKRTIVITAGVYDTQFTCPDLKDFLNSLDNEFNSPPKIQLYPFSQFQLNIFLSEVLNCSEEKVEPLSKVLINNVDGSPFSIIQILNDNKFKEQFNYDKINKQWTWNHSKIQSLLSSKDDKIQLIKKLNPENLKILAYAACLKTQFGADILIKITNIEEDIVMETLLDALEKGILILENDNFTFLHDKIQKTIYNSISDKEKSLINKHIGFALIKEYNFDGDIFTITNHLNLGIDSIEKDEEKLLIIEYNLKAAEKARESTAFHNALNYSKIAENLLTSTHWKNHPEIYFETYNHLVVYSFLIGDIDSMEKYSNQIFEKENDPLDIIPIYETKLQAYSILNKKEKGIKLGRQALTLLGVDISPEVDYNSTYKKIIGLLENIPNNDLLEYKTTKDKKQLSIMSILIRIIPMVMDYNKNLLYSCIEAGLLTSLKTGFTPYTSVIFIILAMIESNHDHINYTKGKEYGEISIRLLNKNRDRFLNPIVYAYYYSNVFIWHNPIKEALPHLLNNYKLSQEIGDIEFASYSILNYLH